MNKQELQQNILKLIRNERELTLMYAIDLVKGNITKENFKEKLDQLFSNTDSMIENRIERLED